MAVRALVACTVAAASAATHDGLLARVHVELDTRRSMESEAQRYSLEIEYVDVEDLLLRVAGVRLEVRAVRLSCRLVQVVVLLQQVFELHRAKSVSFLGSGGSGGSGEGGAVLVPDPEPWQSLRTGTRTGSAVPWLP